MTALFLRNTTFALVIVGWALFRTPDLGVAATWLARTAVVGGPGASGSVTPYRWSWRPDSRSFASFPETRGVRFGTNWRWALAYAAVFVRRLHFHERTDIAVHLLPVLIGFV